MSDSNSEDRTFVDTNVWLYAFTLTQDSQKHQRAKDLIRQTPHIVISTQIINELCYNLRRKFGADEVDLDKLIRSLYQKYLVVEFTRDILLQASALRTAYSLSYWDGLVVSSAVAAGATRLYSEDMQSGLVVNHQVVITNPFVMADLT